MKIFVQTAVVQKIRDAFAAGLADGVVLSPIDLADDDPTAEMPARIEEIAREFAVPVCVPVAAVTESEIYRDGRELARISDQVIVQVPLLEDAVMAIRHLVADGARVCATHVYSGAQAFLAAKIGATMIAVDAPDIDAHGRPSAEVVRQIRDVLDRSELECDLAVSPPRSSNAFSEYLVAGADIAYATPDLLAAIMIHPLTDRGVDRFLSALSKRHRPRTL